MENSWALSQHQNLSKNLISPPLTHEIIYPSSQNVVLGSQGLSYSNTATSTHHTFVDLDVLKADEESKKGSKRMKERKISDIVELVTLWRKLYNGKLTNSNGDDCLGIQDNKGNLLRYSLVDAAKKVGVSKKSLDDYLLQLRYVKKFGFDFNENKESKIGVLRAFVKKKKQEEKEKDRTGRGGNTSD